MKKLILIVSLLYSPFVFAESYECSGYMQGGITLNFRAGFNIPQLPYEVESFSFNGRLSPTFGHRMDIRDGAITFLRYTRTTVPRLINIPLHYDLQFVSGSGDGNTLTYKITGLNLGDQNLEDNFSVDLRSGLLLYVIDRAFEKQIECSLVD